jgi:hypothetical protein
MPFTNTVPIQSPAWPELLTPRNGTDPLNEANWLAHMQQLNARFRYLHRMSAPQRIFLSLYGCSGDNPQSAPAAFWDDDMAAPDNRRNHGMVESGGSADPTVAPYLYVGFGDLPAYCFLTELRLTINGSSVYAGTPANKLTMELRVRESPMSVVGATAVYGAIDPATYGGSPNMTATRDVVIDMSASPFLIDKSLYHYHVAIAGEFGTYAKRYVTLCSLRATIQQPTV